MSSMIFHCRRMESFDLLSIDLRGIRSEMKQIFLLIASYPDSILTFRGPLIVALQAGGLQVHVCAPGLPLGSEVRGKLEACGLTVHDLQLHRTGQNPFMDLLSFWSLWRLMRGVRPEIVMGYTIKPVIYGSLAAWFAGVPQRFALITGLGYAFQEGQARGGLRALVQRLYALALSRVEKVFFRTQMTSRYFGGAGCWHQVLTLVW
ncbi:glycosyltransferase [Ottowia caeni]|uniref:glycosyltransferase n=1 Tax=Ottowia caeni TaxID=2870339 RepID=UPI003D75CA69